MGCGRPGIPSSSSNASRPAVPRRCLPAPREQKTEHGERAPRAYASAGHRLPTATRASAAGRQVGSRRALATEAADPGWAALGPGVRPPAPRLLEAPPFLPLSVGKLWRNFFLLRAGGRARYLLAPSLGLPSRPVLPDPAGVRLVV